MFVETDMISDTVLRRSVLKNMQNSKTGRIRPANAAGDAVVMDDYTAVSVKTGQDSVIAACNALACLGAQIQTVNASVILPKEFDEKYLKKLIKQLESRCALFDARLGSVDVNATPAVNSVVLTSTAIGRCKKAFISTYAGQENECGREQKNSSKRQDIAVVGYIGLDGIRRVLDKYRGKAVKYYTENFIEKATASDEELSVLKSAQLALESGAQYLHAAGDGGIFAALWRLSGEIHKGIDIDFRKIPVKQEIIEICEMFDINPYELSSLGCLLMTLYDGYDIVNLFKSRGFVAEVIGCTTQTEARILRIDDEVRYLEVPRREESERIIFDGWDGKE